MKAPESIQERASELGFEVCGWDEAAGAIRGLPTSPYGKDPFIGSHDEIRAYLIGFANCRRFELNEIDRIRLSGEPALRRSMLVLRGMTTLHDRLITVHGHPHVAFRGERIAIPDDVAGLFEILDIRVGNRSQLLTSGDISAALFAARIDRQARVRILADGALAKLVVADEAEAQFGRPLSMDTCQPHLDVSIVARGREGTPPTMFEALILGRTISY